MILEFTIALGLLFILLTGLIGLYFALEQKATLFEAARLGALVGSRAQVPDQAARWGAELYLDSAGKPADQFLCIVDDFKVLGERGISLTIRPVDGSRGWFGYLSGGATAAFRMESTAKPQTVSKRCNLP